SECPFPSSTARGLFANAEVEPSIAADAAGRRLVVMYQEDRASLGGAGGLDVTSSADGGATWRKPVRLFGECDASAARVSDPWVSIGRGGHVYAVGLDVRRGIVVAGSADGAAWQDSQAIAPRASGFVVDKPMLLASPWKAGTAWAIWEQYHVD